MKQETTDQAMQRALHYHQAGKLAEAEAIYREVLSRQPGNTGALHLLGVIALQTNHPEAAIDLIGQAVALAPSVADFRINLGNALRNKGHLDQAVSAYREALRLAPAHPQAHNNLANALYALGRLDEAIAAYRRALQIAPNLAEAHDNLGHALHDRGLIDEAIAAFRRALQIKPDYAVAHNNLGNALRDKGLLDESIAAYKQALRLQPAYSVAHNNLGIALRDGGLLDESIAAYRRAIELKSDYADAHNNLSLALRDQGRLDDAIAASRHAVMLKPDSPALHSNLILLMHYHEKSTAKTLLAESRQWARQHGAPLQGLITPHTNDRSPDRRLKIGHVSPDLRNHPVGRFMLPLLREHDPNQVEIFCYAQVARDDDVTKKIREYTHQWRNTVGITDQPMADQIRHDQIDILVDLTSHTGLNRLLVFARQPAPVQVTYLAYPGTTGLDTIDYRITDRYLDPPESTDNNYSEKSIQIESYWCYEPPIEDLEQTPPPSTQAGFITFGCLNSFHKVSSATLQSWYAILAAVPQSRLHIHASAGSHRDRVRNIFRDAGIDPERLTFIGKLPVAKYVEEYRNIDIALDPFPYVGGTTTCDALWMGVPVITLAGQTAISRGGASILSNIGLTELIAEDPQSYIRIASTLAGDTSRLSQLRAGMRDRMRQSPLMDAKRFAAKIESAYRSMWRNWCE